MKTLPLLFAFTLLGCAVGPKVDYTEKDLPTFLATVRAANEVLVYEGLPSPSDPRYAAEAKRSDVLWIEGYPFYSRLVSVSAAEKARLIALTLRPEEHRPLLPFPDSPQAAGTVRVGKFCGGFHPDFALVWVREEVRTKTLICFGCREWQSFTARGRLYSDLTPRAYTALTSILSKYASQSTAPKPN